MASVLNWALTFIDSAEWFTQKPRKVKGSVFAFLSLLLGFVLVQVFAFEMADKRGNVYFN